MEMNPVMERIVRLSRQWKTVVNENHEAKVFCWLGNSTTEYRMIRGFVMFHMSEESSLDDVFIACHQPFGSQSAETYGEKILEMMDVYVRSWNMDKKLLSETGSIDWNPVYDKKNTDASNFALNMNRLGECFSCDGEERKLVVCLLPQRLDDLERFRQWIVELLKSPVEPTVCYMLYDVFDSRLFEKQEKDFPLFFKYIIPDMDIYGAINQLLEDKKSKETDAESLAAVNYQQLLLKLTEATGKGEEHRAEEYAKRAMDAVRDFDMPQMEALVYYLLHGMYVSTGSDKKALKAIDNAIERSTKAVEKEIPGSRMTCCQYLVTKANSYFFEQKYGKALSLYNEALAMSEKDCIREMQIAVYQMVGTCKRLEGESDSWDTFTEGWKIAETLDEEQIKNQPILRYYAVEMLKTGNYKVRDSYEQRFEDLWGESWQENMKRMEKEQRHSMDAVD
jgi:tetratricopeptide (TPR) repeat protein